MNVSIELRARHLAVATAVVVAGLLLAVWWASPARSLTAGPDPVDRFAFVARADNPVDALAASSVAGQLGAPVYLTFPADLDEQTAQGLTATDPDVVVLAGGIAALSDKVKEQVEQLLPDATVVRKAGFGRTETAKLINELTGELGVQRPLLAGATVAGDVGIDGALTVAGTDVAAALRSLGSRVDALEADLTAANDRIARLEATLDGVTRNGSTLVFSGMNVQLINGNGSTGTTNGLGNLIVGYNEDYTDSGCKPSASDCQYNGDGAADSRSGSHNLIVGADHTYTSYGGLLGGLDNTVSGIFATVSGGIQNTASQFGGSVAGGSSNLASGAGASVAGGSSNIASGFVSSATGGFNNTASGTNSSVAGGSNNTASGVVASVVGGYSNLGSGSYASVTGGGQNVASATYASVAGGRAGIVGDAYGSRIGNSDFPDG